MAKKVDDNGWWIIKDNPLSKVGIYPYLGKQIDDSLEPNKVYRVFRPAEELLNKETVKSFNLVPLVNDHEMLGKDFSPAEEKGIDGIIYNPRVAHENMLIGNIKIYSEKMMKDIKNGKKELSMGYTCTYDLTPGDWDGQHYDVVQRNLRGNHVALVDRGRMGSDVRVYDKHICCDSMDIVGKVKKVPAKDLTHETWQLRKDTGLNYVTKRKEGTINRLIRESGLPMARKSDATKMFGSSNYRNRFDAKFKDDEAWLNAQKVRFKQTRKKVGWQKMLEMPSYQKYQAKLAELQDILDRRNEIEHEVYGDRAGLDTAWIKVPGEEQNEPNIMDRVVTKSAEAAAIMALLSTVLNMNKKKKYAKDDFRYDHLDKKGRLPWISNIKTIANLGDVYPDEKVYKIARKFQEKFGKEKLYPTEVNGIKVMLPKDDKKAFEYDRLHRKFVEAWGNKKKSVKDGLEMKIIKKIKALDAALNKKLYKLGVSYGKALAKSCKAKSGMDTADVLKTIDRRKKASLDKALNVKLYKLGHSYGKQLRKIVGNKYAQDMATTVAKDILKLNKKSAKDASSAEARLKQARNSFREMGKTAAGGALAYSGFKALEPFLPTEGDFNNNIISFKKGLEYSQGINPDKFFAAGQNLRNFADKIASVPRNLLQNMQNFREGVSYATRSPRALMPSVGYFSEGKKLGDAVNKISGAAQKAVQFGGAQAAKFGNSISGMVGGISPKAAELFAKYPKTTGLAAAAALIGAGYGAYKLWDSKGKKKGSK